MDAKRKLAHFTRLVERREGTGIMCDKIVSALREGEEKVVQQEIERLQPLLKQIYSKIDPHPAFVDVALAATMYHGKGRLTPQLRDPLLTAPVTEPGKFLSSSQFNALAVSIFVAFNFGTTDLPLQAMLMDDPLQSLDDVNMLGLIDLLRRARSNRQVFISTHSDALARLLQRKLRAVGEHQRTVRLDFRGWSRLGPDVDHYDVPRERDRLRVVA